MNNYFGDPIYDNRGSPVVEFLIHVISPCHEIDLLWISHMQGLQDNLCKPPPTSSLKGCGVNFKLKEEGNPIYNRAMALGSQASTYCTVLGCANH